MKTLLRSTFVGKPSDDTDQLFQNYQALNTSRLEFDIKEDDIVWKFIQEFVRSYNHIPEFNTILSHFVGGGEDTVADRLEALLPLPVFTGGDFKTRLEDKAEDRRQRLTIELLQQAGTILQTGAAITSPNGRDTKELKGPVDAIRFVMDNSHDIIAPTMGARLSGSVTKDGPDFKARYEKVKADPLSGIGQHTGLTQMDVALNGAKKSEMWLHTAFAGGMKSTFALNWAYNQAIHYGHDCLFVSLEMPYEQLRNILYAMHSQHEKFKGVRYQLGLQRDVNASIGLPYEALKYSALSDWHPNAERFLWEYVVPDFTGTLVVDGIDPATGEQWLRPTSYGEVLFEVPDPDNPDFTVTDLRQIAERTFSKTPFSSLFIDHAGLMTSRKWINNTTERLNAVLRDLKQMAMNFNRGLGMAVIPLFQINRDGYKTAMKRKDRTGTARYDLTALSYANEAERSSDIVTASWIDDDLRRENRVQFQCLKSRDQAPFEMFLARVEWSCRRVLTCMDVTMTPAEKEAAGDEIDAAEQLLNK